MKENIINIMEENINIMDRDLKTKMLDAAAAALGLFPESVDGRMEFENYTEFLIATGHTKTAGSAIKNTAKDASAGASPLVTFAVFDEGLASAYLDATVLSILGQTYTEWELMLFSTSDDAGLERFSMLPKLRFALACESEAEICALANKKLRGKFVIMLTAGQMLAPFALNELTAAAASEAGVDAVFMDEDIKKADGERGCPHFKTDYGRDTLLSVNQIGAPFMVRASVHSAAGGFTGVSPEARWEYALNVTKYARQVKHIEKIGLTTPQELNKKAEFDLMKPRLDALIEKEKKSAFAASGAAEGTFRIKYISKKRPTVGIIVYGYEAVDALRRCLEAIEAERAGALCRVFVLNDGMGGERLERYLEALRINRAAETIRVNVEDGVPARLNQAAERALADIMLFMNGNAKPASSGFIEELAGVAGEKKVGAVGGKLVDEADAIISVGTVVGIGGWADSVYVGEADELTDETKLFYCGVRRNVTAVSGAFMAVRGEVFFENGKFDPSLGAAGFDTEFCMRLQNRGYRNVFTPFAKARLYSRLPDYASADERTLKRCYEVYRDMLITGDPFFPGCFDHAKNGAPTLWQMPYPAIELNPNYQS